jgi:hypothetical protein
MNEGRQGVGRLLEHVAFTWVHATRSASLFFEHLHAFRLFHLNAVYSSIQQAEGQPQVNGRSTETAIHFAEQAEMRKTGLAMGFNKRLGARSFSLAKPGSQTPKLCYKRPLDENGA